jgi:hypothetical protein
MLVCAELIFYITTLALGLDEPHDAYDKLLVFAALHQIRPIVEKLHAENPKILMGSLLSLSQIQCQLRV